MGIRKYFNWTSDREENLIKLDCDKLNEMAREESSKYYNDQTNTKRILDGKCPNCKSEEIVNKISRVQGSGYVSGSINFGSGYISGSSKTDTNEINHCNGCGNQWKKFERNYKGVDDIIADWLNDLSTHYEGKYTYGDKTLELLKDIHAESIWQEGKRVSEKCYSSTVSNISLGFLRTKFKSVYDKI